MSGGRRLEALESVEVRARFTQYAVPGWGVGELWTGDGLVKAHEFRFGAASDSSANGVEARPPMGAQRPPTGTVARTSKRVGDAFAPTSQRSPVASVEAPPRPNEQPSLDPDELVERFRAFFAGDDARLDGIPIDLGWATPFQHAIAAALRTVPRGEVVSYGELAALAGYPGAARAAGTFCAHNRFMLILPCHRVVGATGIGGYGSAGPQTKRRLLALEGVVV
jgi:methylated-DNA-[protein]-cysteine S-methyltransferase